MQQAAALVADSTIQIAGATGGVGSRAVQRAAAAGALVVATAHTDEDKACVAAFGAAETVSYSNTPAAVLARHPERVDVVIHLAGDAAASDARAGGRLVSTLSGPRTTFRMGPLWSSLSLPTRQQRYWKGSPPTSRPEQRQ
ncbi:hypothetical protein GCM10009712_42140 [Pseudarthrobacter sulfonivorans]|uniref:zinc-binding dehydrogenase n=1 Tax=Pseudarthrobacter sulfonivorans TaxID=121292 RepID=UPI00168B5328|nr:zinc-binding dehydrogenase [Pseudarthrobacter sulfonivorans]